MSALGGHKKFWRPETSTIPGKADEGTGFAVDMNFLSDRLYGLLIGRVSAFDDGLELGSLRHLTALKRHPIKFSYCFVAFSY